MTTEDRCIFFVVFLIGIVFFVGFFIGVGVSMIIFFRECIVISEV